MVATPVPPFDDSNFLLAGMNYVANGDDARLVIAKLVEAAAAALGSNMGSFYVLDQAERVLKPYVTYNFPEAYAGACANVPLGEQCCGRAAKHMHPWIVEDMWTDPLFSSASEGARKTGIRAAFSVPVIDADGVCLGSLASHFRSTFRPTQCDLERQSLFAKLIAFALKKEQLGARSNPLSASVSIR